MVTEAQLLQQVAIGREYMMITPLFIKVGVLSLTITTKKRCNLAINSILNEYYLKNELYLIDLNIIHFSLFMRNIKAVQIAESIDIKSFKKVYAGVEVSSDSSELFYKNDQERYLYITTFGVIVASGYDETKLSELLEFIKPHSKIFLMINLQRSLQLLKMPRRCDLGIMKYIFLDSTPRLCVL